MLGWRLEGAATDGAADAEPFCTIRVLGRFCLRSGSSEADGPAGEELPDLDLRFR